MRPPPISPDIPGPCEAYGALIAVAMIVFAAVLLALMERKR